MSKLCGFVLKCSWHNRGLWYRLKSQDDWWSKLSNFSLSEPTIFYIYVLPTLFSLFPLLDSSHAKASEVPWVLTLHQCMAQISWRLHVIGFQTLGMSGRKRGTRGFCRMWLPNTLDRSIFHTQYSSLYIHLWEQQAQIFWQTVYKKSNRWHKNIEFLELASPLLLYFIRHFLSMIGYLKRLEPTLSQNLYPLQPKIPEKDATSTPALSWLSTSAFSS